MAKKQKDGRYRAKIRIGVDANGNEIVKYVAGATLKVLEQKKQEARDHYINGSGLLRDELFQTYVDEWFETRRKPKLTPNTQYTYKLFIDNHIIPPFENPRMKAIRAADIQRWINKYDGSSKSMISQLSMLIKDIFRTAYAEGVIERDPTAGLIRPNSEKKIERRALSNLETEGVLEVIRNHKDGLFLACLYYLGLRRGEALGLQWGDFDWDENAVHIQRDVIYVKGKTQIGNLKTKAADRWVLIPKPLLELLIPKRGIHQAWVFCAEKNNADPLGMTTVKRLWLCLMHEAGITTLKEKPKERKPNDPHAELADEYESEVTPHYLRHNYITKLFYAGFDPVLTMWMVGHEDYETTVNVYTHLRSIRLRKQPIDMEWVYELKKDAQKLFHSDEIGSKRAF